MPIAFSDAADLVQETSDFGSGDFPGGDPFGGGFDPGSQGGFMVIVIFMPMDGSFDLGTFFDQLMMGGIGGGSSDPLGGLFGPQNAPAPSKHLRY